MTQRGRAARALTTLAAAAAAAMLGAQAVDAHRPVTSPYTFAEDVYPIFSQRCGGCHAPGGVAPMSLLTYDEARPWAESIRMELTAGHMPPWFGDTGFAALRDVHQLSARDLDVVLTWVAGGTPPGRATAAPARAVQTAWRRGHPDMSWPLPAAFALPASRSEDTHTFVVQAANASDRYIAAADLRPGNPAIVHDAVIYTTRDGAADENVLAMWLPGSAPAPAGADAGFLWRAGDALAVRIHYRKTWKYENKPAADRSTVGLYLMKHAPARVVHALALPLSGGAVVDAAVQAVAVRTAGAVSGVDVQIEAVRPDGSRVPLAGFGMRSGWDERYWLARPVPLPPGTRLDARTTGAAPASLALWVDVAR